MESLIKYNCNIETLSPIHIGSGDSYGFYEYYEYEGNIKLNGNDVKSIGRINLNKYYNSLSSEDKDNFLKKIVQKDFSLNEFNKNIKNNNLKSFKRYLALDKTSDKRNLDIFDNVKVLDNIYIPGSSLKGAIRTALLYNSINEHDLNSKKDLNKILESKNRNLNKIMKYIIIGDSSTINIPTIFKTYRTKLTYNKKTKKSKTEYQIPKLLETIYLSDEFKTKHLNSKFIFKYDKKILDSLDFSENMMKYLDIDFIKKAIFEFTDDFIDYELNIIKKFDLTFLEDFYYKLMNKNEKESPVLRIGTGSGLMNTSIALKLYNYDKDIFNEIYKVKKDSFYPKTRMITVGENKDKGMPLGWVKLNFQKLKNNL